MALLIINVFSFILKKEIIFNVILPFNYNKNKKNIPAIYLLHGMGGNHNSWLRKTFIEKYSYKFNFIIIMPNVGLSWYTNTKYDMKYFDFVSKELPKICNIFLKQISMNKIFVVGCSMGGYGAMKMFLLNSKLFKGVVSISGALNIGYHIKKLLFFRKKEYWEGIFGPLNNLKNSINDNLYLLKKKKKKKLNILILCGNKDPLLFMNKEFSKVLTKYKIKHTFLIKNGKHDWDFWNKYVIYIFVWINKIIFKNKL